VAAFKVESIDASKSFLISAAYLFGEYSELADIQEVASVDNYHQADLIKKRIFICE
jgi:hypothetical protein